MISRTYKRSQMIVDRPLVLLRVKPWYATIAKEDYHSFVIFSFGNIVGNFVDSNGKTT
jgi:hypothetical protein